MDSSSTTPDLPSAGSTRILAPRTDTSFAAASTVGLPTSAAAFLRTPLFSSSAKLRLLWEPLVRRAPADGEESVAEFVKRRIGQEFLDYAINPLVAGVYAGDPARLSVRHAFPKLHDIEQRYGSLILGQILGARERKRRAEVSKQKAKKVSFDEGLQVLTETLRRRLGEAVHLDSPVTGLRQESEGWTVKIRQDGRDEEQLHSAVIYTGPAYRLAQLELGTTEGLSLAALSQINYPPVASVVLGFRRADVRHPLDGFGVLIPEVEGFNILGTLFSSSLFPNRAPEGHVTLTSYVGGRRAPELALRKTPELVDLTVQDLRKLLGVSGKPTFEHCFVFPKAIPQYEVGYGRFKELMDRTETQAPGLFLAGNYRDGISLSDSIVSGYRGADRAAAYSVRRSLAKCPTQLKNRMTKSGVLLVNLGSPDSPSVRDVRRYLRQFLMDGRVIDMTYPARFLLVNACILPFRPRQSAEAYQKIWWPEGSPLVVISQRVRAKLEKRMQVPVELAMRYQNPSINTALRSLAGQGVEEVLVIPLFPHYAMSSFETAVDEVKRLAPEAGVRKDLGPASLFRRPRLHCRAGGQRPRVPGPGLRPSPVQLPRIAGTPLAQVRPDGPPLFEYAELLRCPEPGPRHLLPGPVLSHGASFR